MALNPIVAAICVGFLFVGSFAMEVSAAPSDTTKSTAQPPTNVQLKSKSEQTQEELFDYLDKKVKSSLTSPEYPQDGLITWALKRHNESGKDAQAQYKVAGEELRIVQSLLGEKGKQRQRQGLRLAQYTNSFVFDKLKDKWLYARVYEAFFLPHLDVAYQERWQDLSKQRIMEGAAGAFGLTGEKDKQIAALNLLLDLDAEQNTLDWAHGTLAQVLASQGKYEEAIAHLQLIESSSMSSVKNLIPRYQELLQKKKSESSKVGDKKWNSTPIQNCSVCSVSCA